MILTMEMDKTLQEQAKMIDNLLSSKKVQKRIRLAKRRQANQSKAANQDEPLNLIKDTPEAATTVTAKDPMVMDIKTEKDDDLDSIEEIEVIPPTKKPRVEHSSRSAGSFGHAISLNPPPNPVRSLNPSNYPSILWPTITKKDLMNGTKDQPKKLPTLAPAKRLPPAVLVPIVTSLEQPQGGAPPFTMRILLPPNQAIKSNPSSPQIIPEGDLTPENIVNVPNEIIEQKVSLEIVEQPACNRIRFRYECEGRSQSLQGISTTGNTRTYPKIKLNGYKGYGAHVVVSCVEDKAPFRCHPHNLVGKRCDQGVCSIDFDPKLDMDILFKDLGVQCVKKRDTASSLEARKTIGVDPFEQGFQHMHKGPVNLNAIRLCFQCSLTVPGRDPIHLKPIVSDVIRDKKAYNELTIVDCSDNWSSVIGGKKILLFTRKISKTDIEVHFSFTDPNKAAEPIILKGSFAQNDVHEQCGISLVTPPFPDQLIKTKITAQMYLYRPSENLQSEPIDFTYYPLNQDPYASTIMSPANPELGISDDDEELEQSKSPPVPTAPLQQSSIENIIDNCLSIVETEEEEDEIDDDEERPLEIVDEEEEEINKPQEKLKHPLKVRAIEDLMKGPPPVEQKKPSLPPVEQKKPSLLPLEHKSHLQTQTEEINAKNMLCRYFELMEDLGVAELTMVLEMAANMIRKKVITTK